MARAAFSARYLPGSASKHAAIAKAVPLRLLLGELRCPVGRVVVRQHDLDRAGVGEASDPLERRGDRILLVPRCDDDRDRRPLAFRPVALGRRQRRKPVGAQDQGEGEEQAAVSGRPLGALAAVARMRPTADRAEPSAAKLCDGLPHPASASPLP